MFISSRGNKDKAYSHRNKSGHKKSKNRETTNLVKEIEVPARNLNFEMSTYIYKVEKGRKNEEEQIFLYIRKLG